MRAAAPLRAGAALADVRWLVLALLVGVSVPAASLRAADDGEDAATQAARAFYAVVLAHRGAGLPDDALRAELSAVLTPSLIELLAAGHATERRCAASVAPDEKPLLFEADVFVDTYEGVSEVVLAPAVIDGDSATASARLVLVMEHVPKGHRYRAITWQDVVQLRRDAGAWQVDDVVFASGDRLRGRVGEFVGAHRDCLKSP